MPISKHRVVLRILATFLPFALCITLGVVVGIQGGLHNEAGIRFASGDVLATNGMQQGIRLYGALILLAMLSGSALSTLAIVVSKMFPASHKTDRRLRLRKA